MRRRFPLRIGLMVLAWLALAASARTEAEQPIADVANTQPSGETATANLESHELQRLVYSSHVLTVIEAKPELEACLLALLELHAQKEKSDPASLVRPLRETLTAYRADASRNALSFRWRDEVLGRYFEELSRVLEPPERRTATLNLLKILLPDPKTLGVSGEQSQWRHAGVQRLLTLANAPRERQAVVQSCMRQADSDDGFAAALDMLLQPEIAVALDASLGDILAANPALAQSPTMRGLNRLSSASGDRGVVITIDKIQELLREEMAVMQDAVTTSRNLYQEVSRIQPVPVGDRDGAAQAAAIIQRHAEQQAEQRGRIAAASAAALALSEMALENAPDLASQISDVSTTVSLVAGGIGVLLAIPTAGTSLGACGLAVGVISLSSGILPLMIDTEKPEPADEIVLEAIQLVGTMISELSDEMHDRFDRVDRSLVEILDDLRRTVLLVGEVEHDVDAARQSLLKAQAGIHRLEGDLHDYVNAGFRRDLIKHINGDLGFEERWSESMEIDQYRDAENTFYSWAVSHSGDAISSYRPSDAKAFTDEQLLDQLDRPLESNLNFISGFLSRRLRLSPLSAKPVANPRDWYVAASAYLQLAAENPEFFRSLNPQRLNDVIRAGTELEAFFDSITLNRELFNAVLSYYEQKLNAFDAAVNRQEEDSLEPENEDFKLSMWRQWEAQAPRLLVGEIAASDGYSYWISRLPTRAVSVAAGSSHSLAVRTNGTVVAWGNNSSGQCNVPAGLTDVVAVSAGSAHSLALKRNGTIVAWGSNYHGQCNVPPHENVTRICAGPCHSLALRADGRVIAWGFNGSGACDVPEGLANVIDIVAAPPLYYVGGPAPVPDETRAGLSLALKDDGTVVGWGIVKVPDGLADVAAIAAGPSRAVALKDDGSVVGFPAALPPVTGVNAVAVGGTFTLALKNDGTVRVIDGALDGPTEADNIAAISAGERGALALRKDGVVVAWGRNEYGTCGPANDAPLVDIAADTEDRADEALLLMEDGRVISPHGKVVPPNLGPVKQVAIGAGHGLALQADGTVTWWKSSGERLEVPDEVSSVVAIAIGKDAPVRCLALRRNGRLVAWGSQGQNELPEALDIGYAVAIAVGNSHNLALRGDGRVTAWGQNRFGQCDVPEDLTEVVAISAEYHHNLALKADGTVVAWGWNSVGQCNVPEGLDDVVAIAAGERHSLALKTDGTVTAWGDNAAGRRDFSVAQTGVLAMAHGERDWFLVAPKAPGIKDAETIPFMRGELPTAARLRLRDVCAHVRDEFDLDLNDSLNELTGAKALLESVVALGLPETLEQDDVLRGLLYGSESLIDRAGAEALYEAEQARLEAAWRLRGPNLKQTPQDRLERFRQRLDEWLDTREQSGTPEIPAMVENTLLQLRLLKAAY